MHDWYDFVKFLSTTPKEDVIIKIADWVWVGYMHSDGLKSFIDFELLETGLMCINVPNSFIDVYKDGT